MSCGIPPTTVDYKGHTYVAFGLNESTTTVEDVSDRIVASDIIDSSSLSSYNIKIYDEDVETNVIMNNCYLREKPPWNPHNSEQQPPANKKKKVMLTLVPKAEPQSSVQSVLPPCSIENNDQATISATQEDQEQLTTKVQAIADVSFGHSETTGTPHTTNDDFLNCLQQLTPADVDICLGNLPSTDSIVIDILSAMASLDSTPLRFVVGPRDEQRQVYLSDRPSMIQAKKDEKYKSEHPYLQIPQAYVDLIRAGGLVDLVTAVVVEVFSGSQSYFCLAPFRGFLRLDNANQTSTVPLFANPLIWTIKKEDLEPRQITEEEQIFLMELRLCLIYEKNQSHAPRQPQLVRFNENFVLFGAQPVSSNVNHEPGLVQTNEYVPETFAENELYLMCLLRLHINGNLLNWESCCRSSKFTVASRYHPVKRKSESNSQQ